MADNKVARPGSLEPLHDASMVYRYVAPPGTTLADCRRPDYWRNNARECGQSRINGRPSFNRIEILAEDGTWEADLRVLSVADGLVHTRLLREWSEPAKPGRKPAVPDGYTVEHIQGNGWRALDPNSEIVGQRLPTEEGAVRAAADHARRAKGGE
jgi:hypothetical protein